MKMLSRRPRRDFVAELAPAREWAVAVTVHRGAVEHLQKRLELYGVTHTVDDADCARVTLRVSATRRAVAERIARRRVERAGFAVFGSTAR